MFSKREKIIFTIFYPIITLVAVVVILLSYNTGYNRLHLERQAYFERVVSKTVENVDVMLEQFWDEINLFEDYLCSHKVNDITDMEKIVITNPFSYDEDKLLFVFDDNKNFTSSDGHTGDRNSFLPVDFTYDISQRISIITTLPCHGNKMYFLFVRNIPTTSNVNEYAGIAVSVDYIESLILSDDFGKDFCIYLVDDYGNKIHTCGTNLDLNMGNNIYDDFEENATVLPYFSSGEETQKDTPSAKEIKYKDYDEKLFVINLELESVNSNLVAFALSDTLAEYSTSIIHSSYFFIPVMCVLVSILFVYMILVYRKIIKSNTETIDNSMVVNKKLSEALITAERTNEAKSTFLSHMSHDIRTPLNGIIGMNQIARKNINNPNRLIDCLDKMGKASDHLLSLLNDILDLSRIECGKTPVKISSMNLYSFLDNCYDIIEGQISDRLELKLIKDYGNLSTPYILADELHLRQILINILGNAVKFTPDGGSITLSIREFIANDNKLGVVIKVKDTGIGMSEEFLKVIWEPFVQYENNNSHSNYAGTGLGMTITKNFVELLGGTIDVESKINVGTTFTLMFTFDIDYGHDDLNPVIVDNLDLTGKTILLVDDNDFNREICYEILNDLGAKVFEASNGLEAVDLFTKSNLNTFDIILMDVMMPIMNGQAATREIRSLNRDDAKNIPIVALTANAFEDDIKQDLECGMTEHLSKPIDITEFKKLLAKLLNRR